MATELMRKPGAMVKNRNIKKKKKDGVKEMVNGEQRERERGSRESSRQAAVVHPLKCTREPK